MQRRGLLVNHRRVHATISPPSGSLSDVQALFAWLQRDDEFRGRVRAVTKPPAPGEMGGAAQMVTVALGSGGAIAVLAATLSAWVTSRRTRITVDLSVGDKIRRFEIDGANAADAQRLFRSVLESADEPS
jgi:hypothetical protein